MQGREFDGEMLTGGMYIAYYVYNFIEKPMPVPRGIKIENNGYYYYVRIKNDEHPIVISPNPAYVPVKETLAMTNTAIPSFTKEEAEQLLIDCFVGPVGAFYKMVCNGIKVSPFCKKFRIYGDHFIIRDDGMPIYICTESHLHRSLRACSKEDIAKKVAEREKDALKVLIDAWHTMKNMPQNEVLVSQNFSLEEKNIKKTVDDVQQVSLADPSVNHQQHVNQTQIQTTNISLDNPKEKAEQLLIHFYDGETIKNFYTVAREKTKVAGGRKKFKIGHHVFVIGDDGKPNYIIQSSRISVLSRKYAPSNLAKYIVDIEAKALNVMTREVEINQLRTEEMPSSIEPKKRAKPSTKKHRGHPQMITESDPSLAESKNKRSKSSILEDSSVSASTQMPDFPQWDHNAFDDDVNLCSDDPPDICISDDENVFGIPVSQAVDVAAENKVEMPSPILSGYSTFFSSGNQDAAVLPLDDLFTLTANELLSNDFDANPSSAGFFSNYDNTLPPLLDENDQALNENDKDNNQDSENDILRLFNLA